MDSDGVLVATTAKPPPESGFVRVTLTDSFLPPFDLDRNERRLSVVQVGVAGLLGHMNMAFRRGHDWSRSQGALGNEVFTRRGQLRDLIECLMGLLDDKEPDVRYSATDAIGKFANHGVFVFTDRMTDMTYGC